ncbi:hypothetical protein ACQKFO_21770 [Rossellomorea sp. NPDC071047]|uniref:hypothetical protein n=1 Tax=Rossellomorea sp. NPDC071047 TaxID=3390675 RepID=UPI003CFE11AE
MKKAISTLLILTAVGFAGCSNDNPKESAESPISSQADTNTQIKNGTIKETAETFVQGMISADENVLNKIYQNPEDPLEYMLPDEGPEFSGLTLDDFIFEFEEDNEVQLERKDGEGSIYWLEIEKIGDEYFVTGM